MSSTDAENLLTVWAELLATSFADAGVTDVVISPGSRNTPFVIAFARCARLRTHDVIDERAAAFYALGQARVTGRPSVVLCTSGSACGHYLPAIIEAKLAGTPILLLTADRPFELQACGAAQTIDQLKLFGDQVNGFFEIGVPDDQPGSLRALRRIAAQAVAQTRWPQAGAVHVNVRARKPLEPRAAESAAAKRLAEDVARLAATPIPRLAAPRLEPDRAAVEEIVALIKARPRGIIVAAPMTLAEAPAAQAIAQLAARAGYPLVNESGSQGRFTRLGGGALVVDAMDTIFRSKKFRDGAKAELIIQFGGTPTSTGWEAYSNQHPDVTRVTVGRQGWNDPQSAPAIHLVAEPEAAAQALAGALGDHSRPAEWRELFAAANAAAWHACDAACAEEKTLTEGDVAAAVVSALPGGSILMLGNSLPVRLVDTFCPQGAADARVIVQRGANGIDGNVAGLAGTASVAGGPVTLLIGDVSLFHDLTSLFLCARQTVPTVIVVIQNQGGRIFEQLPLGSAGNVSAAELAHITTPHALAFEPAAKLFGLRFMRVTTKDELGAALTDGHGKPGASLIEAIVPPHGAAALHKRIWSLADASLAALVARP